MLLAIRIRGITNMNAKMEDALNRLRLRRKFAAVLIDEKDTIKLGMLNKVRSYVAYGKVDEGFVKTLKEKRGQKDSKTGDLKPFFRLHPPRGGFKKSTKVSYPRGVLGEWKDTEIIKMAEKML